MGQDGVPTFASLEDESDFWDSHSVTEFEAAEIAPDDALSAADRRPKEFITLALDAELVTELRTLAAEQHIPTGALVNELLWQRIRGAVVAPAAGHPLDRLAPRNRFCQPYPPRRGR